MEGIPSINIAGPPSALPEPIDGYVSLEAISLSEDVARIFRVAVPVSDLDRAISFYAQLLDIDSQPVSNERHYFDCGSVILAVVDAKSPPNPDYIYFSVPNLEKIHARAKELGCLVQGIKHDASAGEIIIRPWGERSFYALDPFWKRALLCRRKDNLHRAID
jgi:predicted enzyme related to lactoylglutathione lyase